MFFFFFFQAEDGIRDTSVTGVQTCALPICFSEAALIMATLPLALVGGFWLMFLLGYNMSVASAVGFIALGGVAAEIGVEIGRASCRERVEDAGVAGATKKERTA